ncbi:MAG: GHKL domain-containing protein [Lachnospiraceae bacterium]
MREIAQRILAVLLVAAFAAGAVALLLGTLPYREPRRDTEPVERITGAVITVDGESQNASLPLQIQDLAPGTTVTAELTIQNDEGEGWILVRSAFAPLLVEADGEELLSFGHTGERPAFMKDPGTGVFLLRLAKRGEVHLTLTYTFPMARSSMKVQPIYYSTQAGLFRFALHRYGTVMIEGLVLVIGGILVLGMGALVRTLERQGTALIFLGAFTALTGLWGVSNCDLAPLLWHNASLCYVLSYVSFFAMLLPLLLFLEYSIPFHAQIFYTIIRWMLLVLLPVAVLLQAAGIVMFHESVRLYQILLPLTVLACTVGVLTEAVRYRNRFARTLSFGMGVLLASTVMELASYMTSTRYDCSAWFLGGTSIFCVYMCLVGALDIRSSWAAKERQKEQEQELSLLRIQIQEQKKHQDALVAHEKELSRLRHDYRHELTALSEMVESGDLAGIRAHLDTMRRSIPDGKRKRYCENAAVNAVVSYYVQMAEQTGAEAQISLNLPAALSAEMEQSLCVVFGNLLENAAEAVARGEMEYPFVRLTAIRHLNKLVIHMENSCSGKLRRFGKFFVSSKREEVGIGLASITSVARVHGGDAHFDGQNGVFVSDVYLDLVVPTNT